jgi:hypothetical protein
MSAEPLRATFHPYLMMHGVQALPDAHVCEETSRLLVPLFVAESGRLVCLAVGRDGSTSCTHAEASRTVGELRDDSPRLWVTACIVVAMRMHAETGDPVELVGGVDGMASVSRRLAAPGREIIALVDRADDVDTSALHRAGASVAKSAGRRWLDDGLELADAAIGAARRQAARRFEFADVTAMELTAPVWLVQGWIERDCIAALIGPPKCGKSFVAFDLALSVAAGTDWHGRAVQAGPVVILAGEGHRGMARRVQAWSRQRGVDVPPGRVFVSSRAAALTDPDTLEDVIEAIRVCVDAAGMPPALVVVDTLARCFGAGDENSSRDMVGFIAALDAIRARFGCSVLVVHHTGHAASGRGRGSSAFLGALDTELLVECPAGRLEPGGFLTVRCTAMKDALMPPDVHFAAELVQAGEASSIALRLVEGVPATPIAMPSGVRMALYAAVQVRDADGSVCRSAWREAYAGLHGGKGEAVRKGFTRAEREMLDAGALIELPTGMRRLAETCSAWADFDALVGRGKGAAQWRS